MSRPRHQQDYWRSALPHRFQTGRSRHHFSLSVLAVSQSCFLFQRVGAKKPPTVAGFHQKRTLYQGKDELHYLPHLPRKMGGCAITFAAAGALHGLPQGRRRGAESKRRDVSSKPDGRGGRNLYQLPYAEDRPSFIADGQRRQTAGRCLFTRVYHGNTGVEKIEKHSVRLRVLSYERPADAR